MTTPVNTASRTIAAALAITPVLRWLILSHSVANGQPCKTSCGCGNPLWPQACGPTGRCRACGSTPGPPAYTVEITAVAAVAVAILATHGLWSTAASAWWALAAVVLAYIDAAVQRLPYRITAIMAAGFLGLQALASDTPALMRAAAAAVLLTGAFATAAQLGRGQLGWGDAALAAPIGAFAGTHSLSAVLFSLLAGFTAATIYLTALRLMKRPAATVALGPFLLAGALAGIHL